MTEQTQTLSNELFDVVIIGAGIVGCAIARRFTLEGAKVAILEKGTEILDGASKANSAILHTAFDAPPDSLEHSCIREGYHEYLKIRHDLGLPLDEIGAYVVAWSDEEVAKLDSILAKAHKNDVTDTKMITADELRRNEPNLAEHAKAAISIPGESIIDPWSAAYAYLGQALENGAEVFRSCAVTTGKYRQNHWKLDTSRGFIKARHVINSAGLYGDLLDQAVLGTSDFKITPRKGQFVVYDKAAAKLLKAVILPVPSSRTKGVVLFRTVFGNLVVGPTAEDQESRSDASTDKKTLQMLMASATKKIPALQTMPVTAIYAGLRPATEFSEYQIRAHKGQHWITVGGIRSTGLSAALGIANYVFKLYTASCVEEGIILDHSPISEPKVADIAVLAESSERDWQKHDHGEIVCHCELVTRREIEKALTGPLAARSLQGLKRQSRVTMGRCQGFFCAGRLGEIVQDRFEVPLSEEIKT